jgi:hypothetical protein
MTSHNVEFALPTVREGAADEVKVKGGRPCCRCACSWAVFANIYFVGVSAVENSFFGIGKKVGHYVIYVLHLWCSAPQIKLLVESLYIHALNTTL